MVVGFTYNQYTITGIIIKSQEKILTKIVTLTAFIPLLTGAGVNVRAQSSTVVIRGMNTDEMRSLGTLQIVGRETIATVWVYFLQGRLEVAIAPCAW